MKEKILQLRLQGKSYNEIKKILGCSKSTISFHCGIGQKEKNNNRTKKNRSKNKLSINNAVKAQALKLRSDGKTYPQIMKELNISKSMVCYYCGENQSEKRQKRTKKYREANPLINKVSHFKDKKLKNSTRDFQRRNGSKLNNKQSYNFNPSDIIKKFGVETKCYLSGVTINLLLDKEYSLDHIKPASKDGDNSIENLGITHSIPNKMKNNLTVEEFISWCEKILIYNGYKVIKIKKEA